MVVLVLDRSSDEVVPELPEGVHQAVQFTLVHCPVFLWLAELVAEVAHHPAVTFVVSLHEGPSECYARGVGLDDHRPVGLRQRHHGLGRQALFQGLERPLLVGAPLRREVVARQGLAREIHERGGDARVALDHAGVVVCEPKEPFNVLGTSRFLPLTQLLHLLGVSLELYSVVLHDDAVP